MSAAVQLPVFMSVEEFMDWESGDGHRWQLVDGVPQAMAPASITHGALQSRLAALLDAHFERRSSPCRVITTPGVVPRVQSRHNVRIPDLGVTCLPPSEEDRTLIQPIVLIEILSPSNRPETWSNVWTYTTLPSVREILVLRTATICAELLRRHPDGTWPEEPQVAETGDLVLESIDFRAPLDRVFGTTRLARAQGA